MALHTSHAQALASSTKGYPVWQDASPRWLLSLLPWLDVKAGIFRLNRVTKPFRVVAEHEETVSLPDEFADYQGDPWEFTLSTVQTVVRAQTRVTEMLSAPHDQLREQIRLALEGVKEEKERRLITSDTFGLLKTASPEMRITGGGEPTPDDLDSLLALVWKKPGFFLAHPRAIAAFGRQCTARGVSLETVEMLGVPFITWRGVPIVPTDKLPIDAGSGSKGTSSILLLRVGEEEQGVLGLHQEGIGEGELESISIRFMGIDQVGLSRYLITAYFSLVVLAQDALGVLEQIEI